MAKAMAKTMTKAMTKEMTNEVADAKPVALLWRGQWNDIRCNHLNVYIH